MAAWLVEDGKERRYFVCGPCATKFYNAKRETRTAPREADPPDGVKAADCDFTEDRP